MEQFGFRYSDGHRHLLDRFVLQVVVLLKRPNGLLQVVDLIHFLTRRRPSGL